MTIGLTDAMRILHRCLGVLLVVMLLPWGAWLAAAPLAPATTEAHDTAQAQVSAPALRKRCRTATLPGTHCALPAILPENGAAARPATATSLHPAPSWAVTGHLPQVPRSPPRPS